MKLETQCVVCGSKEVFQENFCKNCFAKDHPFVVSPPKSVVIRLCIDCGALKSSNRWLNAFPYEPQKDPILSELLQQYWKSARIPNAATLNIESIEIQEDINFKRPLSYNINFRIQGEVAPNKIIEEFHSSEFNINWIHCDACIAIRNQKYKAILQLRYTSSIDFGELETSIVDITEERSKSGDKFAYLVGYENVKNGVNFLIGSVTLANTIASKFINKYGVTIKTTQECVGWDKMKNRSRYRDVIIVRFPFFAVGDFLRVKGEEIWQITNIGNGKIQYYNFSQKKSGKIIPSEIEQQKMAILIEYKSMKEFQIISIENDAVLLMDLDSYKTYYYAKKAIAGEIQQGRSVLGFFEAENLIISVV